ncbi:hypothetical protein CLAFUW4_11083 [Fulvia fulva]|uniref:Uncharacterized protein n=1 Tax=Passalora fulva TaxID=5499 RepID=A0A9Q8PCV3_PASFU|nr:uncharacterized protein CLAFUR5_10126 [Fulvia fulva]KAK4620150.1 hypothetical protein CLAFUR4_11088 [Fulvia fulva]KAK4621156.1 hypothetical protein CLAFUR0_11094 [Fulvia fulva]UJO20077.1 hypothetical protein CLAFUR5_10126 [Fulvia fulva]WPV17640.1 hypothetical protein CLAFUW4_11083 [Fulvia fulva]WPV32385.1 hypothetical protein CLAFUW7_11080 [Fulvia fulva]
MDIFTNTTFPKCLAALNLILVALIAGAASTLYISSIPIIKLGRSHSSKVMLKQFRLLVVLGGRYLQTGSRIWAASMAILTWLLYVHQDEVLSGRGRYSAAALFIGAQAGWYEIVYVFPTNDRLMEMEVELLKSDDAEADQKIRKEVLL